MSLLGPDGRPIQSYKKADPPKMGPAFGDWAGRDVSYNQMPGGAILQFDLSQLTLADYRAMRHNPQINASLSVLTFMLHQIDWWVECEDKKIATMIEDNLREMWTRLIRGMSQALWAGFSPMVIEWENNTTERRIEIGKFKDLIPEDCEINWKTVQGYAPQGQPRPKFKEYDGIKQWGQRYAIPPENTLWYPLMMENGDYYGRKLLKAAFAPWYFSTLMHLFANRYYERFGEPTPVGRAPFDADVIAPDGTATTGRQHMELILMNLRNRGTVILPSDTLPGSGGSGGRPDYEYDIEYLESQMRGADFERYMMRLDEEMSLAIFTPILLMRTGDVGSNNLGVQHTQTWLWMLNALAGDMKEYIDRYVCERLKGFNFSPKAPRAQWHYRKMGKESVETLRAIVTQLIGKDKATVDLDELGMALGMTLKQVRIVQEDPNALPGEGDGTEPVGDDRERGARPDKDTGRRGVGEPRATGRDVSARIKGQVEKAWRDNTFGAGFKPSLGYRRRFTESLRAEGFGDEAPALTSRVYEQCERWLSDAAELGMNEYSGPADFMALFDRMLDSAISDLEKP
jgi:hypothetical protein